MTLAECRNLRKGDKVSINLGNGWTREMEFLGLYQVTSYGNQTLSTIDRIDWSNGKTEWQALCAWECDRRGYNGYFRPRALRKVED